MKVNDGYYNGGGFISPELQQKSAARNLETSDIGIGKRLMPNYRVDPSYWWSKKKV